MENQEGPKERVERWKTETAWYQRGYASFKANPLLGWFLAGVFVLCVIGAVVALFR